jgi:hypothetical protein
MDDLKGESIAVTVLKCKKKEKRDFRFIAKNRGEKLVVKTIKINYKRTEVL